MKRIFISYKRVDKDNVLKIKERIESISGVKCWLDIEGIESDAQFKHVIINAINNAEIVLFMYSNAHSKIVDFENDWTVRELNFAKAKKKRIVFINIDGTPLTDEFAFDFGMKQQVDARSIENINRLVIDIQKWLNLLNKIQIENPTINESSEYCQSENYNGNLIKYRDNPSNDEEEFKSDVVMSFSSKDIELARKLVQALESKGLKVWYYKRINDDIKFFEKNDYSNVKKHIDNTCFFIPLLTNNIVRESERRESNVYRYEWWIAHEYAIRLPYRFIWPLEEVTLDKDFLYDLYGNVFEHTAKPFILTNEESSFETFADVLNRELLKLKSNTPS